MYPHYKDKSVTAVCGNSNFVLLAAWQTTQMSSVLTDYSAFNDTGADDTHA